MKGRLKTYSVAVLAALLWQGAASLAFAIDAGAQPRPRVAMPPQQPAPPASASRGLFGADLFHLRSVAEIEQYFIALRDAGAEAVMLRYPREGHSMRETRHVADFLDRSLAWYDEQLASAAGAAAAP